MSTENKIFDDLSIDIIKDYFDELDSILRDLTNAKQEIIDEKIEYNQYNQGKYQALMISAQKLLDIIYFEVFFVESKNNYENFQLYSKYKEDFLLLYEEFSRFKCVNDLNITSNKNDLNTNLDKNIDQFKNSWVSNNWKFSQNLNILDKTSKNYLNQGKRLLEETNQCSQQILLNLNTQREQLDSTTNKLNTISESLDQSSFLLDKMSKWWHKII